MCLAETLSSANLRYSSLKLKIAEGSIPINGVSGEITSLKILTLVFAICLACSKRPFDKNARPDSS